MKTLEVTVEGLGCSTLNVDTLNARFAGFLRRNSPDIDLQRRIGT